MLKIISDAYSNGLFTAVIPQMPGGIATAVMIAGIVRADRIRSGKSQFFAYSVEKDV